MIFSGEWDDSDPLRLCFCVCTGKKERKCKKEEEEEDEFEGDHGLNPQQVEAFLNILCEETDIAQVELKMGGFKMKVRRSLSASTAAASVAPAAPMVTQAPPSPIPAAAPVSPTSSSDVESDVDEDDGSTISITAPKVGIMRRGRYIKGKKVGKAPAVEVGDTVKKGQALCFIEQLGTFWPVEAPQAGEIDSFVVEEGEPVEYGEDLLEIVPFFGGHIIGDSKHA